MNHLNLHYVWPPYVDKLNKIRKYCLDKKVVSVTHLVILKFKFILLPFALTFLTNKILSKNSCNDRS